MGIRDSAPGDPPRWLRSPSKRGSPGRWIPSSPAWQRPVKVTAFANAIAAPPRSGKSVKLSPPVHPNTISPSPWYWTPTLAAWRAGAAGDNWRLVAQPPQEPRWLQAWKLDQPSKNFSLSLYLSLHLPSVKQPPQSWWGTLWEGPQPSGPSGPRR